VSARAFDPLAGEAARANARVRVALQTAEEFIPEAPASRRPASSFSPHAMRFNASRERAGEDGASDRGGIHPEAPAGRRPASSFSPHAMRFNASRERAGLDPMGEGE